MRSLCIASAALRCWLTLGTATALLQVGTVRGQQQTVSALDLARLRDVGGSQAGLSISPSGRWLAYNVRQGDPAKNAYSNRWMLLDLGTRRERVLVADAGLPLLSYGNELYPWDDFNQGIQAFPPVWSKDEKKLVYVRRDSAGISLYSIEPASGKSARLNRVRGKIVGLRADSAGAHVTLELETDAGRDQARRMRAAGLLFTGNEFAPVAGIPQFRVPTERRTLLVDVSSGDTFASSKAAPDACRPFPGWPRDQDLTRMYRDCALDGRGRSIAIGVDLGGTNQPVAVYTMVDGKPKELSPHFDWIDGPLTWHGDRLYFVARVGYARSNIYALAPDGEVKAVTNSPFLLSNCVFHFGAVPFAVCTGETLEDPRELIRVELATGKLEALTDLNPEYKSRSRPRTVEFRWTSPDGDVAQGTITYPIGFDSTRRYPVVVTSYPHPGFTRGSNGDEFPIPVLAAQGFLVLDVAAPAYQYWTSLDITFETFVRGYAAPLNALEGYLRKLADEGVADLRHAGICGLSGGGNFAAYAVSHSELFSAAIFNWHESDYLATITLGRDRTRELYARRELGAADTANWRTYSIASRPEHVKAAILMNTADSEFFFAFGTFDALKRNGNAIEMWVFPESHHVKWLPGQRLTVYERNVDWFNFWLRDTLDPAPHKADQYRRWKDLRVKRAGKATVPGL